MCEIPVPSLSGYNNTAVNYIEYRCQGDYDRRFGGFFKLDWTNYYYLGINRIPRVRHAIKDQLLKEIKDDDLL
jgi:hypothetical protein